MIVLHILSLGSHDIHMLKINDGVIIMVVMTVLVSRVVRLVSLEV